MSASQLENELNNKGYFCESSDLTYMRFSNPRNSIVEVYPTGDNTYLTVINGIELGMLTVKQIISKVK